MGRTGGIAVKRGRLYARVTWVDKRGKRHAKWRAARDNDHAQIVIQELLATLPPEKPSAGIVGDMRRAGLWVYFIEMQTGGADQPIKIGVAADPKSRLVGLATSSPYPLRLVFAFQPGNGAATEAGLHKKFAKLRMRGEWFRPETALLDYIELLKIDAMKRPHLSELVEVKARA